MFQGKLITAFMLRLFILSKTWDPRPQDIIEAPGQIKSLASDITRLTGTGRMTSAFPARSAMWRYKGTPFSAAPALQTARDTPKMALAPNLA